MEEKLLEKRKDNGDSIGEDIEENEDFSKKTGLTAKKLFKILCQSFEDKSPRERTDDDDDDGSGVYCPHEHFPTPPKKRSSPRDFFGHIHTEAGDKEVLHEHISDKNEFWTIWYMVNLADGMVQKDMGSLSPRDNPSNPENKLYHTRHDNHHHHHHHVDEHFHHDQHHDHDCHEHQDQDKIKDDGCVSKEKDVEKVKCEKKEKKEKKQERERKEKKEKKEINKEKDEKGEKGEKDGKDGKERGEKEGKDGKNGKNGKNDKKDKKCKKERLIKRIKKENIKEEKKGFLVWIQNEGLRGPTPQKIVMGLERIFKPINDGLPMGWRFCEGFVAIGLDPPIAVASCDPRWLAASRNTPFEFVSHILHTPKKSNPPKKMPSSLVGGLTDNRGGYCSVLHLYYWLLARPLVSFRKSEFPPRPLSGHSQIMLTTPHF